MGLFDNKLFKKTVLTILSLSIIFNAFIGYFLFLDKRISFTGEEVNMVFLLVAVFTIMGITAILSILFFTDVGQQAIQRFKNKLLYKTGKYVNTIYCSKSGVIKEVFVKAKDDGTFEINKRKYVRVPSLLFSYKSIPTYYIVEDSSTPISPFGLTQDNILMSCAELDTVMSAETNFDLLSTIMKYGPLVLLIIVVLVGVMAVGAFLNYQVSETLRDGTARVICSNAGG